MKKLVILALAAFGAMANADAVAPLWSCRISGNLDGKSISLGLGFTNIEGTGTVSCVSANGARQDTPVKLKIGGINVGFGFTDYSNIEVATANFGVVSSPEALVGSYSVGPTAGVTLVEAGINVGAAIHLAKEGGLSFELAFVGAKGKGLEAKLSLQAFEISAAN